MPVYEFACPACRKTLRFFARRPVADADPPCPHCGGKLSREVERFLAAPRAAGGDDALGAGARDPAALAAALAARRNDLESGDPGRLAAALRAAAREGGLAFAPDVDAALRRVEAGGGADALGETVDAALAEGAAALAGAAGASPAAPFAEDETLYDLPLPPLPPRRPNAWQPTPSRP